MKLTPIKANMTEVEIGDKTILFSYKTPVAYFQPGFGYVKTGKFWSVTTSKHINQWLRLNGFIKDIDHEVKIAPQSQLDDLIK